MITRAELWSRADASFVSISVCPERRRDANVCAAVALSAALKSVCVFLLERVVGKGKKIRKHKLTMLSSSDWVICGI